MAALPRPGDRPRSVRPAPRLLLAAALAAAWAALAAPAAGQRPDSAELVDRLRDRQEDFERYRRHRFPPAGRPSRSRCDERVGRYCLFHDDEDGWEPPPEDPEVRQRRRRLIERLGAAADRLPGDGWVVGQRIRYLVAAGRFDAAERAARSCRAASWWCTALAGFVHHRAGRPGRADSAFAVALGRMSDERRRRWRDPTAILEDEAADRLEETGGAGRRARLERLWWLSDPLWSAPGRGRRAGHLARRVRSRMQRDAAGPYGDRWGDDLEELTLRYGWPVGWQRLWPDRYGFGGDVRVVAHHAPRGRIMVPPPEVLEDPFRAGPGAWPLDPREPRSEYAPPRLDTLVRPAVALARFARPDTLHVAAAWRWGEGGGAAAELHAQAGPRGPGAVAAGRQAGPVGRLAVASAARPVVVSLELVDREARRAARYRIGVRPDRRPEGLPGLSDVLLLSGPPAPDAAGGERPDSLLRRAGWVPAGLAGAVARARPPGPVRPGDRVGLYWEAYGPASVFRGGSTEVRLAEADGGLLEDLARGLGLAGDGRAVTVSWPTAPAEQGRVHTAGVAVSLPPEIEPGDYRLEVIVRLPGREPLRASRRLEVEEGEG